MLLHRLQALLGVVQVPFGLSQTPKEAKRIPVGQVMAHGQHVRDARAAKTPLGQLDQRLRSLTRDNTLVPSVVRQVLARSSQVSKRRSGATASINT